MSVVSALLASYSWHAMRQHPWRYAAALLAVTLGVALAFAVHLINASALGEFAGAVRSVNGQPDLSLQDSGQNTLDERFYAELARRPDVQAASPILEATVAAGAAGDAPLKLVGVDALVVAPLAPDLMPRLDEGQDRLALFAPRTVFLNAAARLRWPGSTLVLQLPNGAQVEAHVAGQVPALGPPLAVMDIGALQDLLGRQGTLSRIDLRLAAGQSPAALQQAWPAPSGTLWRQPGDDDQRASNISRAYRVNLTVLALVALFTGAFLVYSVLALSVARRSQQFALLGVLGLTARERLQLILAESAALGAVGSLLGLLLGAALAGLALGLLGGDLGGGYFEAGARAWSLPWSWPAAAVFGVLGLAAALAGGWWPARQAASLPPAQALKGLGGLKGTSQHGAWLPALAIATALLLCLLPPIAGMALGAYGAIALLLMGCVTLLPSAIRLVNDRLAPRLAARLLPMLAVERARHARETAAVAVSGVVAALALSVALTVMVASFRTSVTHWLDTVLPAELYVRIDRAIAPDASLTPAQLDAIRALPGVARVAATRQLPLQLDPARPPVMLLARDFADGASAAQRASATLPLVGTVLAAPEGSTPVYVSESFAELYGLRAGQALPQLGHALPWRPGAPRFVVAGVWRDYARQQGAMAIERQEYQRWSGDAGVNDVALWFQDDAHAMAQQEAAVRQALSQAGLRLLGQALAFSSVAELRATSLRIFDRSFAVTYWLQAVAIGIGLFGVAASFSAQVLARRKEFGMLQHLGFTRGQIRTVVAGEGAAWTAVGSVVGLALGIAVSVILVEIVNPQSFHWSMDMDLPAGRLALLCSAVVAVGTATAWLSARAAAGRDAVLAVKEDW
ncbi:MAG: hypothetical protein GAK30_02867 [Paracidovorax wautersii]|uniref:ABC3 transporter permease C-terminal domain-containing protein n=1 Tax=Paracidovorax wautersii TaxID=1177982 RepID=A0A7V8FM58_9BURK|nr:MAG: hypothetical protein GAK30_02867 [Paracidovorax wautersii]